MSEFIDAVTHDTIDGQLRLDPAPDPKLKVSAFHKQLAQISKAEVAALEKIKDAAKNASAAIQKVPTFDVGTYKYKVTATNASGEPVIQSAHTNWAGPAVPIMGDPHIPMGDMYVVGGGPDFSKSEVPASGYSKSEVPASWFGGEHPGPYTKPEATFYKDGVPIEAELAEPLKFYPMESPYDTPPPLTDEYGQEPKLIKGKLVWPKPPAPEAPEKPKR